MRTHNLKTWPEFFSAIFDGSKTFEVRRDDRGFVVGDTLALEEFDPGDWPSGRKTGRKITAVITYKLHGGNFGIERGFCVLGLKLTT